MAGYLTLALMGRRTESKVGQALAAADWHELGLHAPPHGLYLVAAD
jgi:hypothetical protein